MNTFNQMILHRRSCRQFTDKPLTEDQVVDLLSAGLMAPSSRGKRSWQFIVVDNQSALQRLSTCRPHGATFLSEAPLAIVVMGDPLTSDIWYEDASIAATYIQLQAEALGLGSCWVQIHERESTIENTSAGEIVHDILNIPLPLQVLCIIAVGHPAKEFSPTNPDSLPWEKVHLNTYQDTNE